MGKLYLMARGESESDSLSSFTGKNDSLLSSNGVIKTELVAKKFVDISLDFIFTSIQTQSLSTSEIIKNFNFNSKIIKVIPTTFLNDRDYGNLSYINNATNVGKTIHYKPPHGESLFFVYKRSTKYYLEKINPIISDKNVLIVADIPVIQCLVSFIEELPVSTILQTSIIRNAPVVYEF